MWSRLFLPGGRHIGERTRMDPGFGRTILSRKADHNHCRLIGRRRFRHLCTAAIAPHVRGRAGQAGPGIQGALASMALPTSFAIENRVHRAFRRRDLVGVQHGPHDNGFGIERFGPDIASRCARVPLDLETVNRSGPGFAPFSRHANIHDSGRELRLAVECLMNRHPQLAQSNFWPGCRSRMGKIVRRSAPRRHGARAILPTRIGGIVRAFAHAYTCATGLGIRQPSGGAACL